MQGCICPHPPLLIPEIGGEALAEVEETIAAMRRLSSDVGEPETVVVVSPHSQGFGEVHLVRSSQHVAGDFGAFGRPQVSLSFETDLPFVELLLALGGGDSAVLVEPTTDEVLDHGVLVPLHFLPRAQVVALSVVQQYASHRALGRLVRRCAEELGRDVLFVASGDLSHRLTPSAPAGFDPRGAEFDERIVELMRAGDFAALTGLDRAIVRGAGECGLRSLIALGGFLGNDAGRDPEVYSYEGPYGVGYLVARFGHGRPAAA
jgi:MEMO1 family protein